ncbi:MAG: hypothetical protein EHM72_09990 [Calditrichaeota bacterium]|nr:MAG: hypothetical protein EHM72_09990 [Calditrichota bacterium]
MIGKTLLHYKIVEKLGAGGMGVVYKAHDSKLDRDVAIKVLHPSLTSGETDRQRFIVEAKAAAALNHSNIAVIHAIEEFDSQLFIVLEYIHGKERKEIIAADPIPLRNRVNEMVDWALQIANGLNAAHNRGIIHRDIKSSNIMLTDDGRIKIMDFGLAKFADGVDITKDQTTLGTVAYMAPELIKGKPATPQSDIFSYGVVLYEMLTGKLPFDGEYEAAILYSIMNEEPPPVKTLRPDCPSTLSDVVSKCLEKETKNRFQTMEDILNALSDDSFHLRKTALSKKHNFPIQLTSFIGRGKEIETIRQLLAENRLVSLTGAGGCGKSRLAQEAVRGIVGNYPDGVWFIELAALTDGAQIDAAIAAVFQITEQADKTLLDILQIYLENKSILLILDNCEHLIDACSRITETLLKAAADIRIMTTSREALRVPGEKVWRVPSLTMPTDDIVDPQRISTFETVQLFVDRAQQVQSTFELDDKNAETVANICRSLDGIPLAIELAASRIRLLTPHDILDRLTDRFLLLTSGNRTTINRHKTLRTTIDWSHDLLSDNEKVLFRRLPIFIGGCDLQAIENICADPPLDEFILIDLFAALVDKSLITSTTLEDGSTRYRMLESIRQYAAEKLDESGDMNNLRRRQFDFYVSLAETAFSEQMEKSQYWANRFELELDNIKSVLDWIESESERLRLAGALGWFWYSHSHFTTGLRYLRGIEKYAENITPSIARALPYYGYMMAFQGNFDGIAIANKAIQFLQTLPDSIDKAIPLYENSILQCFMNDFSGAVKSGQEIQRIGQKLNNKYLVVRGKQIEAFAHICQKDAKTAEPIIKQTLFEVEKLRLPREKSFSLHVYADCALANKDFKVAEKRYLDALYSQAQIGYRVMMLQELIGMACALSGQKRYMKAVRIKGFIDKTYTEFGATIPPMKFWLDWIYEYIDGAIEALGEEKSLQAMLEGRAMNFDHTVQYAADIDKD